ncbi:MAG: LuxR C-terminal-related transcriptional regulator [Pseudomonadota bacterium]
MIKRFGIQSNSIDSEILISIYDAAISQNYWREALDKCAWSVGATGGMLYEFSNLQQVKFALNETNSALHAVSSLLAEYNQLLSEGKGSNYDQEGLGATHETERFNVLLDSDIWTLDEAYLARPEVQIGLRAGFLRRLLVNLSDDPNTFRGAIFLYDDKLKNGVPSSGIGVARQLAPHLAKAVELNRLTFELRRRYDAALTVLDKIDTGILILTEKSEIVLKNRAAEDLFAAEDSLTISRANTVSILIPEVVAELNDAVNSIACTAAGENDEAGRLVQIPRRSGAAPLLAVVSPLRDAEMELEMNLSGVLVTLIDPLKPMKVQSGILSKAYSLSNSEKRLVEFVLRGQTNKEIATELGLSPETIKSQLSSLFEKCGCRNRIAFVWRVFQFAPPIS